MSSLSQELSALGPLFQVSETTVTVPSTGGNQLMIPANPMRWSFRAVMSAQQSAVVFVSTSANGVANGQGFAYGTGAFNTGGGLQGVSLNFRDDGPLVQSEWHIGLKAGTTMPTAVLVTIFQVLLQPG